MAAGVQINVARALMLLAAGRARSKTEAAGVVGISRRSLDVGRLSQEQLVAVCRSLAPDVLDIDVGEEGAPESLGDVLAAALLESGRVIRRLTPSLGSLGKSEGQAWKRAFDVISRAVSLGLVRVPEAVAADDPLAGDVLKLLEEAGHSVGRAG